MLLRTESSGRYRTRFRATLASRGKAHGSSPRSSPGPHTKIVSHASPSHFTSSSPDTLPDNGLSLISAPVSPQRHNPHPRKVSPPLSLQRPGSSIPTARKASLRIHTPQTHCRRGRRDCVHNGYLSVVAGVQACAQAPELPPLSLMSRSTGGSEVLFIFLFREIRPNLR